jgi:hypothetical protein
MPPSIAVVGIPICLLEGVTGFCITCWLAV